VGDEESTILITHTLVASRSAEFVSAEHVSVSMHSHCLNWSPMTTELMTEHLYMGRYIQSLLCELKQASKSVFLDLLGRPKVSE